PCPSGTIHAFTVHNRTASFATTRRVGSAADRTSIFHEHSSSRLGDWGAVLLLCVGFARQPERDGRRADARFLGRRNGGWKPLGGLFLWLRRHANSRRHHDRPLRPSSPPRDLGVDLW